VGGEGKPLEKSERRTVLGDVPESNGFYGVDIIRMPFDFRDDDAVEDVQNEPKGTVIIIDPFCEFLGKKISAIVRMRGYATVEILSDYLLKGLGAEEELSHLGVPSPGDERRWANGLPPVAGVISESDAGLGTAERLQVALDAWCSNGIHEARRNKLEMFQVAQKCGLHTARQRLVSSWGEARPFLEDELGILPLNKMEGAAAEKMCVLKPVRGCSSQNVVRCSSLEEAEEAFAFLLGKQQYGGGHIEQILVQGFLEGQEYAVDTVSCDGQHKVVGLWKYDKRPANGAPFVYHSTQLVPAKGEVEQRVLDYVVEVLDALEIQYGPAHTEVIVTDQGPALVEVNGRWHLADVAPLTRACVGRDAVALSADALLPEHREAFHDAGPDGVLPSATAGEEPVRVIAYRGYPMSFQRHGMIVHLVRGFFLLLVIPVASSPMICNPAVASVLKAKSPCSYTLPTMCVPL